MSCIHTQERDRSPHIAQQSIRSPLTLRTRITRMFAVFIALPILSACGSQAGLIKVMTKTQDDLKQCHGRLEEQVQREREMNKELQELKSKALLNETALRSAHAMLKRQSSAREVGDVKIIHELSREQLAVLTRSVGAGVTLRDHVQVLAEFGRLKSFLVYSPKNHVLSGYARFSGFNVDLDAVNQWNRTRRFSRVYLDKNQSVVLESELDVEPGVSTRALQDWIKNFGIVINLFHHTLRKRGPAQGESDSSERINRESI